MGLLGRLRRTLGWVEKVEAKYALLERAQQAWKVIKPLWFLWFGSAATTIASVWRSMTLPWFEPWVWSVGGLTGFFVSTGLLVSIPYRRMNKLQSVLSRATTIGGDEQGYMSVVPLVQQPKPPPGRDDLREKVELWYDARARAAYVAARDLLRRAGDRGSSATNGELIRTLLRNHVIGPAQNFCDPFERAVRGEGGAVDTEFMSQWLTHYRGFITCTSALPGTPGVSIFDTGQYQKWKELHDKLVDYTPVVLAGGKCTNIRRDCERTFDEINRLRLPKP